MALDPNILLQGRTPDLLSAVSGGLQLGQQIRQQPLREALMKAQVEQAQRQAMGLANLQRGQGAITTVDGVSSFQTPVFDPRTGQVNVVSTPIQGSLASRMGETVQQQTEREILEAQQKADIASASAVETEKGKLDAQIAAAEDKEFHQALGRDASKVYSDLQKSAQQASAFIPRLNSLKVLASKVNTGTGAEIKLAAKKALGIDSANMEELNAKLGELAQDILNQQTGTKTDYDFQNAVRQSAALGKTKEANIRLIDALINRQLEAVTFGDMAKEAFDKGGVRAVLDMRFQPTEHSQALEWAQQNPNDPRAQQIMRMRGVR